MEFPRKHSNSWSLTGRVPGDDTLPGTASPKPSLADGTTPGILPGGWEEYLAGKTVAGRLKPVGQKDLSLSTCCLITLIFIVYSL